MPRFISKLLIATVLSTATVQVAAADAGSTIRSLMSDISRSPEFVAPPSSRSVTAPFDTQTFIRSILGGDIARTHSVTLPSRAGFPPRARPMAFHRYITSRTLLDGLYFSGIGNIHHNDAAREGAFLRHYEMIDRPY